MRALTIVDESSQRFFFGTETDAQRHGGVDRVTDMALALEADELQTFGITDRLADWFPRFDDERRSLKITSFDDEPVVRSAPVFFCIHAATLQNGHFVFQRFIGKYSLPLSSFNSWPINGFQCVCGSHGIHLNCVEPMFLQQ